ncbi:hypothetical protein I3843_03G019800 [Carya illinoinensis]|uniref:Uncharacterized protein n=1 Tax=Carya illinoinensis TaxID=32201 RepID=A0A8T1QW30_CARIL|nr:hypothetical protein I3760_03G016900 [Carya illinoinensis]KAG6659288.1 hypothetical protein CIPAW_03G023400 [Carya illinoinensis]KAG7985319.1 hypothetical protein I3843_03G019800 [Carya illinoinensis]
MLVQVLVADTGIPCKRAISCGKPDNPSYSKCIAKQKPKCKDRYKRDCELAPKGN